MKFRWTQKELEEVTNTKLLETLITERKGDCSNTYAPLYKRLVRLERWLEDNQEQATEKFTIVIVVQDGIIQEVAVTKPQETWYRVIDLDTEKYGDFCAESQGIDLDEFTKEKLGE